MKRTKGERRHFSKVKKNKIRKMIENVWEIENPDDRFVGVMATTPHPCSCMGCANVRHDNGKYSKTRQELLSEIELEDELKDDSYACEIYELYEEQDYLYDELLQASIDDEIWDEFYCGEE